MRRPVVWSEDARQDLRGIADYIADDNVAASRKVAAAIRKTGDDLGKMAIGHYGRMSDTYEIGVSRLPYIIAYTIQPRLDGGEDIIILRVMHTARNWTENKWPD